MKYYEKLSFSDMDERQHLSGSSTEFDSTSQTNYIKRSGFDFSIKEQLLRNKTVCCIVVTIIIVCFVVIGIEKKNDEILSVGQAQDHKSRLQQFEVPKPIKSTVEEPTQKKQNNFNIAELKEKQKGQVTAPQLKEKEKGQEEGRKEVAAPQPKERGQQGQKIKPPATSEKQKQKKETKNVPTNENIIAEKTSEKKINAGALVRLRNQDLYSSSPLADEERSYYQQKYKVSEYDQLPFCIVVPSYNNAERNRHKFNINSILMQQYENYHIVFIDDASTDGTGQQIKKFLIANQTKIPSKRFTVIKNEEQKGALSNIRMAAKEFCKPEEIFLRVDGDDELLGRQVLKLLNSAFQKQKAWFIYTNFLVQNRGEGQSRPYPEQTIQANDYRYHPFLISHLRAFYTQLFLNIQEEDLKDYDGNYLTAADDMAICLPILEMSHEKVKYVHEFPYLYKADTGQNNHLLRSNEQKQNEEMLRLKTKYQPLKEVMKDFTSRQKLIKASKPMKFYSQPKQRGPEVDLKIKPPAIKQKEKKKKETKKVPTKENNIAGITPAQKIKAGSWVQIKNQNLYSSSPLADEERSYYQKKYKVSKYDQLPFCIVVPSYNNAVRNRHINNINSILMQEYTNYHIVFIDDASTDGTGEQVEKFLVANQTKIPSKRFTVVKNKEQKRAMPNLRMAAKEFCKPEQIFLIVDGDDELLGRQVLKFFNSVFQKQKVWFVYTNSLTTKGGVGYSRPYSEQTIKDNKYRSDIFYASHLRAFYTQLFLNIKEKDLKDKDGNQLKAANDVAICMPILEMSHEKVRYVPELTYLYNEDTGQNNHKIRLKEQKQNHKMIKSKPRYKPLTELFPHKAQKKPEKPKNGKTGVHSS